MLERVWRKGNPLTLLGECKLVQALWRTVWRFLKKLEIELPYDPAIPLLGIHTKETRIERDTWTPVFIAALFIIARTWKHPRCPSADEWIRKLWYIYTMEYSVQFSSVAQSCPTLYDPMNCSTPGLPVHHQLRNSLKFTSIESVMPSSYLILCCPLLLQIGRAHV